MGNQNYHSKSLNMNQQHNIEDTYQTGEILKFSSILKTKKEKDYLGNPCIWEVAKSDNIPVYIDDCIVKDHESLHQEILKAIQEFHSNTVINYQIVNKYEDLDSFIHFRLSKKITAANNIGKCEGVNIIWLQSNVKFNQILHEMMHILGFVNEHQRPDRDLFVEIQSSDPEFKVNKEIVWFGNYDPKSIMHHPWNENIKPKKEGPLTSTQIEKLREYAKTFSKGDIARISFVYGSDMTCTFRIDLKPTSQAFFECITCWGENSQFVCCVGCKYRCHINHNVIYHQPGEKLIYCSCGYYSHCVEYIQSLNDKESNKLKEDSTNDTIRVKIINLKNYGKCQLSIDKFTTISELTQFYKANIYYGRNNIELVDMNRSKIPDSIEIFKLQSKPSDIVYICTKEIFISGGGILGLPFEFNKNEKKYSKASFIWEEATLDGIPIYIDKDIIEAHQYLYEEILKAINEFHNKTIIKYKIVKSYQDLDSFIHFQYSEEITAASSLGKSKGANIIWLESWVKFNGILHEMVHILGFIHEHQSPDRHLFVDISHDDADLAVYKEGFCFGKYDPESVMHYKWDEDIKPKKGGYLTLKQITKLNEFPKTFSKGDIDIINFAYGQNMICTYDDDGRKYTSQAFYECITCWGENSQFVCCVGCRFKCHADHNVIYHQAGENTVFCDCGQNNHSLKCTDSSAQGEECTQPGFKCITCPNVIVCFPCHKKCHATHSLIPIGKISFECSCNCLKNITENNDENSKKNTSHINDQLIEDIKIKVICHSFKTKRIEISNDYKLSDLLDWFFLERIDIETPKCSCFYFSKNPSGTLSQDDILALDLTLLEAGVKNGDTLYLYQSNI